MDEYYWEYNFPHTPTMFALRGNQYQFIEYRGVWDTDELYDLKAGPLERNNLIHSPKHQKIVRKLRARIFQELKASSGAQIPLAAKPGTGRTCRRLAGRRRHSFRER